MTPEQEAQLKQLEEQKSAKQNEASAYRRLQALGMTDEFKEYSDMLIKTVAGKMMLAFTGSSIKSYEDFLLVKGEVIARLQPLQEVVESGAMAAHLEQEIKDFYLKP